MFGLESYIARFKDLCSRISQGSSLVMGFVRTSRHRFFFLDKYFLKKFVPGLIARNGVREDIEAQTKPSTLNPKP
jgi:hypothetical protein